MNLIITKLILLLVSGHPRAGGADTGDGLGGLRGLEVCQVWGPHSLRRMSDGWVQKSDENTTGITHKIHVA